MLGQRGVQKTAHALLWRWTLPILLSMVLKITGLQLHQMIPSQSQFQTHHPKLPTKEKSARSDMSHKGLHAGPAKLVLAPLQLKG